MFLSRQKVAAVVDLPIVGNFIMGVVLFNAILLGVETSHSVTERFGWLVSSLDNICLVIFVIEIAAKLYARGWRFFLNGWNLFDFVIVGIALAPGSGSLSVLRALRIFRLFRVVSVSPSLRRVVEGFITALPGMASVFLLMGIIFYIGAVISTKLYSDTFPEWFGSLGASAYSLFQIMTLESWSMGIVRPVMEVHPHAWIFFVPFILVTTFATMNLVVGLIVNSMESAHDEAADEETADYRDQMLARLEAIEVELKRHRG